MEERNNEFALSLIGKIGKSFVIAKSQFSNIVCPQLMMIFFIQRFAAGTNSKSE